MRKGLICVIAAIMAITILTTPAFAWFYNDYPTHAPNDLNFEKFGPRSARMLIKLYAAAESEWEALKADPQELDITDWPLTQTYYDQFTTTYADDTNVVNVGGEFGIRCLDMNNNPNHYLGIPPDPNYPNPQANINDTDPKNDFNPMSDVNMRRAVLGCIDRDYYISNIIGSGSGVPLWCALPPVTGAVYYDPSYMQGYLYSNVQAEGNLTAGKFKVNGATGYRYWDRNDNNIEEPDEWVELKFIYRSDDTHRTAAGLHIIAALQACELRINIVPLTSTGAKAEWMVAKNAHLYTAGWSLGSEPDSIVLWMGDAGLANPDWSYYWHPGQCYNTGYANDPAFNVAARHVEVANSISEAITNMAICNERLADQALEGPMFCYSSSMANARTYVGGTDDEDPYEGQYWNGTTLVGGYGTDSFFGFLNMHPQGFERPTYGTIRYGFKTSEIKSFNPIYAEWVWDNNVLGLIYDSLIATNPNDLNDRMPWATKAYEVGSYLHPTLGTCTKIRFFLKEDMYWSDGNPVTMKDIYFTLVELKDLLRAKGYPNPWWYSSIKSILSFSILDPYTFEVLINVKSIWAFGLTGAGVYLLPEHIWRPIIEDGDPTATAPDVNMIGSGPWRLSEYTGFSHVGLVANSPGSTVTTTGAPFTGSTPTTSTKGFHSYYPIRKDVTLDGMYNAKTLTPGAHTIDVNLFNEWYDGSVTVDKVVKLDGVVIGSFSGAIASRSWHNESIPVDLPYGKHTLAVLVNITAPADFAMTETGDPTFWCTIKEDIGGGTFLGNSCPDIKVDLKDVFAAALAFGSYPGHAKWNSICDLNLDYKVDLKDYFAIVGKFGFAG